MFNNFKADIGRYTKLEKSIYIFFEQGLWAIAVYRFGREVRNSRIPVISWLLKSIAFLLFKFIEIMTGISLPASAQIGQGFYVGHFGGIVLHSDVKIGENCSIGPGVVIGTRGGGRLGAPVIGDNVYIGVGAKVLGRINIGNNVKIGANAVVLEDVPHGATVGGIPAKILKLK
ncbi:MAG: serine acetyltransferase [Candidatus Omnitrophica bacterium]|nr:serine acetyltransferase [Candidatus Omnitrophota bacterium]